MIPLGRGAKVAGGSLPPPMSLKIDQDHARFRRIVRGKIRENLPDSLAK